MAVMIERTRQETIHPFHAVLLAGTVPLFLGALLSDYAYWSSYQTEWSNFASWLIVGGEVFGAAALLCAVIGLFRGDRRGGRPLVYILVLLVMWVLGFINTLIHARDAWAVMPAGLVLSVLVAVLACTATWIGFSTLRLRAGGAP
jgi:uncharacterized membrane protein